jgi:hypothetical protein
LNHRISCGEIRTPVVMYQDMAADHAPPGTKKSQGDHLNERHD